MAAKLKTAYFCQQCGYQSPKWMGRCPACQQWNTFAEEVLSKEEKTQLAWRTEKESSAKPVLIDEIGYIEQPRIVTPDGELNRVLGGGIVPGSLVLIGGEPGIGKSTLLLQLALRLPLSVLYVSGEESQQQIKMRAERMEGAEKKRANQCHVLTETDIHLVFKHIEQLQPQLVIVDSIQTLFSSAIDSAPGSISQVRECAAQLLRYAKESTTPVILIGHITKEGMIAGPKVLEHMVDTVLQFEGDRHLSYRILRTIKNRFGSTAELGIYEMQSSGLRQVNNPSEILLSQRDLPISGISVSATLEGNRPLLIEVQSLVSPAAYGTPQRSTTGFDIRRLNMLLAVLEKRGGYRLGGQDVFLNIAGGLRVEDPATDLAVCLSVISSYEEKIIPPDTCFAGEVGLGGEIRAVSRIESRIAEAERLGFKRIFISRYHAKGLPTSRFNLLIQPVIHLSEVVEKLIA
ncbi:MAG: DNA repair protein RadA [Cytophagales bacterium]|nr:DNA repair protein RadA [Bernardetiaceae bacterium]MDW8209795.1 DNA repair protein RadA [Cytophagales bacterium]